MGTTIITSITHGQFGLSAQSDPYPDALFIEICWTGNEHIRSLLPPIGKPGQNGASLAAHRAFE